jgi:ribosomal 30S subunit maturation factor RimM
MSLFAAELKKEYNTFVKKEAKKQDALKLKEAKKQEAFMKKQARQARARRTENSPLRNEDFYYTDASKYAKKYYGETFHETTRFDNDWD